MDEKLKLALRARRFFPNAPRKQAASQAVKWAESVIALGDKYLLAKQCERLLEPRPV